MRGPAASLRAQLLAVLLLITFLSNIVSTSRVPRQWEQKNWNALRAVQEPVWIETLSWVPRASLYHNFLSLEECEHLIKLGMPTMAKSMVVDNDTGESKDSEIRTSRGSFLKRNHDEIVTRIEERIASYSTIPAENGEALHILHYEASQHYAPHYDYFHDPLNTLNGGQRLATMLLYLSDVEEGGETVFPSSDTKLNVGNPSFSMCGQQGVAVKPHVGDALLFWNQTPNGTLDTFSLHSGCPVIRGNKWSATKWMRVNKFVE